MSYCETEWLLLEWSNEAVPGLPAYTVPDWPDPLNGDCAPVEWPGVTVYCEHVVLGAPGCPGPFGLGVAAAVPSIDMSRITVPAPMAIAPVRMDIRKLALVHIT
jgi:hypothetical protein